MTHRSDWEEFFDSHAPHYMENEFTQNTRTEVDFILEELRLRPESRILDVGCGTGRHVIELAKRGHRVTGLDISEGMLAQAKAAAEEAGVQVKWIHSDATQFKARRQYDAVVCLCEGAFSLINMNEDPIEHDLAILQSIHSSLKPGGGVILTAPLAFKFIRECSQDDVETDRFNPITMVETYTIDWQTPDGETKEVIVRERKYVPSELAILFELAGFDVKHVWGGTAGKWGRRALELDEMEVMIVATKRLGDPKEWWEATRLWVP